MKVRVPMFAKIAALFLTNILVIGLIVIWVLHQGWGMMAVPAYRSDKLEEAGTEIFKKLEQTPFSQWDDVLAAASKRYGVTFYLYSTDGPRLAGPLDFIPGNVHGEITGGPPLKDVPEGLDRPPPPSFGLNSRPILTASDGFWSYTRGYLTHKEGSGKVALITRSESPTGNGFYANTDALYWIIAGVLLVSVVLWAPFVHSVTSRLRRMQSTAGKLALGDFGARADDKRSDELGALGHSVNHMADQIGALVNGQKRLLGDIAHELSSPIARMQAIIGILESPAGMNGSRQTYIERLDGELQQMGVLVQELISLSKANLRRSLELRPILLRQQIQRVIEREKRNGETIVLNVSENSIVISEPELLARAIGNVLRNAIRYAGKAGAITIESTERADETVITISDQGPGVPDEALPRLFDAFYRPDSARTRETGGSGLGLAIVKSCVEATHGTVSVRNRNGGGLIVEIVQQKG